MPAHGERPVNLCRSWLFVDGADDAIIAAASRSGADVLIQELEDFTPPPLRPKAHALAPELYRSWREAGAVAAVRVNPLDADGMDDLAAVMRGRPDIVALPKVAEPAHVAALDAAVSRFEREYGIPEGATALLPNIEFARGLVQIDAIAKASRRTQALLVAAEDMAADLHAERAPDSAELAYVRQRFLVECVAARVVAVDCPYTWSDAEGVAHDTRWARRLGYRAKSLVSAGHAAIVNGLLTPAAADVASAERIVAAFDAARERGEARVEVDGALVEVPGYLTAKRLLMRAAEFREWEQR